MNKNNLQWSSGDLFRECIKKNNNLVYLNLENNTINVSAIEEIQTHLQSNLITAAKNKVPSYKREVTQLKLERESDYQKTLSDIDI